ncbi:MAG: hypothetical protein GY714_19910 [Desulfobacterales bacterium]|nr:hypothetical protein [Desulfobacterales bacterium]
MTVDESIISAVENWINHGLDPGSCTRLLLEGKYEEALSHAHPLIKPHWHDHIAFIQSLPEQCRGENMEEWKKLKREEYN